MNDIRFRKKAKTKTDSASIGRRKFIKTLALGGGALVVGGVLAKSENVLSLAKGAQNSLANFRLIDRGSEVSLYDKSGNEILIVDKTA